MLGIVISATDRASVTIGEQLLDIADWTVHEDPDRPDRDGGGRYYRSPGAELREFDDLHLHLEGVAEAFDDATGLVFAARHAGDTGPLLTVHHTGNIGPADYGGSANELATAAPNLLDSLFSAFTTVAPDTYDVGLECTHHGPSEVGVPSVFAEVGSGPDQWEDTAGAGAVARAILEARGVVPARDRTVVGFGGGHYAPRFDRIARETDWAVGHVAAGWALDALGDPADNRAVIRQVFERTPTCGPAPVAIVDGNRPGLEGEIDALGYRIVSEGWLQETSGVPLDLVGRVEARLGRIDDGLRFGDRAPESPAFETVTLPAGLLAEANGIDQRRVRAAVSAVAVAYQTVEGGTQVAGSIALPVDVDRAVVVDELVAVLRTKYDTVSRRSDEVVARHDVFDPTRARELGVPEGPAFGRLAAGEAVEVDGRTVRPSEVTTTETYHFSI